MIDIVYPYVESFAAWQELRYSLRSLEQNFNSEFRVNIIGDLPKWVKNVRHIPHKRTPGLYRSVCYDACTKMAMVAKDPEISEDFIWMNDDIYLLLPSHASDFNRNLALQILDKEIKPSNNTRHQGLIWDTFKVLKANGFDEKFVYNTANHTPQYINKNNFIEMCHKFAPRANRLLPTILYANLYPKSDDWTMLRKETLIRAGFYGFNGWDSYGDVDEEKIKEIMSFFWLLNHNDQGLTPALKKSIENKFSKKSQFEI